MSDTKSIQKILIANRGEIALRVIKTCKKLGISTVAVFSEADRDALHVREADEAVLLGPPPSGQSYLLGDKIIEICKDLNVDAIHPGYGFLSENAGFAKSVEEAGIIFIGPSAHSITLMGSKIASKQAVEKHGVPMVPGTSEAIDNIDAAKKVAAEIGYPILIKASAGGGGKGMRICEKEEDFESQMKTASSEAISAFGDGAVFIEKFVTNPRHIEIQVLADKHGNTLYLFERECSIQRRHQKLVEEAPSSCLTPEVRKAMGEAAARVAEASNYVGAGTVEFLVDDSLNFYFLEMNTRLQVEHPVTELITGLDLVEQQIRVAEGHALEIRQEDLKINGHAIELRLCAEDPEEDFLPNIGKITIYDKPDLDYVRVDDCVESGYEIPIYYDNMFAKLIVWGPDRNTAIQRMKTAINHFRIDGIKSTREFGLFVMNHPNFNSGEFDTKFIEKFFTSDSISEMYHDDEEALALLASYLTRNDKKVVLPTDDRDSDWYRNRL